MLEVKGFRVGYGHEQDVVKSASLSIEEGKIAVLLGPNGSGKSTLLKAVAGAVKARAGELLFDGQDISKNRAKTISYVPQSAVLPSLSVFDTILSGRMPLFGFHSGKSDEEATWETLKVLGLEQFAMRNANELSGGEMQLVMIARALCSSPKIILLDEPTANLDIANALLVRETLKKLAEQERLTLLIALHDVSYALNLGDEFYGIKNGEIIFREDKSSITPDSLALLYGVKPNLVTIDGETAVHFGGAQ